MLFCGLAVMASAGSTDVVLDALLQRPRAHNGTVVVPDRFLRSFDPITVFYPAAKGPKDGGAETDPEEWVTLDPAWPGAWTWLDARTLQFRPAEPYPPLEVFAVDVKGASRPVTLATLMTPPSATQPRQGASDLSAVERIVLTFPRPIAPDALARMITIEVRPLPGIGEGPAQRLTRRDFEVKVLDRARATDPARYALVLHHPISLGRRATVRFGLSLDDADEAVSQLTFSTAEPFRVVSVGCRGRVVPVSVSGGEQAADAPLRCTQAREVQLGFSATLAELGPIGGRNLVRFEPAVADVSYVNRGRSLVVRGAFEADQPYRVSVAPAQVLDVAGRPLQLDAEASVHLYFPRQPPYLRWQVGQGVLERLGPKDLPMEGRGHTRADLRIYEVDPLNRNLWPFPTSPLVVDEAQRPPGPGERPEDWASERDIPAGDLTRRLMALGSPGISTIVELGADPQAGAARFGLDLTAPLTELSGANEPGHYLVGVRRLDAGTQRSWVRVQVTDLSLTTVENPRDVLFAVSSLSSGQAVSGATVRVDGVVRRSGQPAAFETLFRGRTTEGGEVTWEAPGPKRNTTISVSRIVVQRGDDVLVLQPRSERIFRDGHWHSGGSGWLQWMFSDLARRGEPAQRLGHLFTERPIYRPSDEVHLKGFVRSRDKGRLTTLSGTGEIEVRAPGGNRWTLPVEVSRSGSVYARWQQDDPPTGVYSADLRLKDGNGRLQSLANTSFQVEAYRLPTFEVQLHPPDGATQVANDRPFDVTMTASYYAGGRVSGRPVRWRVTQYPYTWTPGSTFEDFRWSSDGRFSGGGRFRATPQLSVQGTTTAKGVDTLALDPGIEADAMPRTYVVEATVTGADEQTVTETLQVHAVPAFALGLKVPRFVESSDRISAQALVVGPDGSPVAGQELTVRLLQRQWHSVLQASDFSNGEARYLTDVVDEVVTERTLTSTSRPMPVNLGIEEAGVYLVELEARDALGRVQVVRVDLYAAGDEPVSWDKPKAGTFQLVADRDSHRPGQRAKILVQSPFQRGQALVVVEAPQGNEYLRVPVRNGAATVSIPVREGWVPRVPVHVLLRTGRNPDAPSRVGTSDQPLDAGKPQTVASTLWLQVEPVENQLQVEVTHPERALPGATVPLTVRLKDPSGRPRAGEVTLWLVDQAVLALAKEQRLDPLPDFLPDRRSHVQLRDTRNEVVGRIPRVAMPGGDGGEDEMMEEEVLERTTIRKDFRPIAYYEPTLKVGSSGVATVNVPLPDNLTVFKVRAKAVSGPERFGVGTSQIAVRLPVVVQPTLPRFVRPGDRFEASALARVVEGSGGAATAEIRAEGLAVRGPGKIRLELDPDEAARVAFPVVVDTPEVAEDGQLSRREVSITLGAVRSSDSAGDAAQVRLPLRDDRRPRSRRVLLPLEVGGTAAVPALPEEARANSVRRTVVVADHEGLARLAGAVDLLRHTQPRSTSERLSRARVLLGLGALREPLQLPEPKESTEVRQAVEDLLAWLPTVFDDGGRIGQWPGTRGRVGLTADALLFCVDAKEAGYAVDGPLEEALIRTLRAALRSDYSTFLDGESWYERARSLWALTSTGRFEDAYFAELARKTRNLGPDGSSMVLLSAHRADQGELAAAEALGAGLSKEVLVQLYQGQERYAGLASWRTDRNPLIAASEAQTLAHVVRALHRARPDDDKVELATDALVRMGGADGWGHADVDAAVLLALGEQLTASGSADARVELQGLGQPVVLALTSDAPVASTVFADPGAATVAHQRGSAAQVLATDRWIPAAPGSEQAAEQRGFVVSRAWNRIRADGPADKIALQQPGRQLEIQVGDVIEDHVRLVVPETRHHAVLTVPLAAGMEPMNPALATAPPEARPEGTTTARPSWVAFYDDAVTYTFETLPKGTYDVYFRTRASTPGRFVQPAARAEMIYDRAVVGLSPGAKVTVTQARPAE